MNFVGLGDVPTGPMIPSSMKFTNWPIRQDVAPLPESQTDVLFPLI